MVDRVASPTTGSAVSKRVRARSGRPDEVVSDLSDKTAGRSSAGRTMDSPTERVGSWSAGWVEGSPTETSKESPGPLVDDPVDVVLADLSDKPVGRSPDWRFGGLPDKFLADSPDGLVEGLFGGTVGCLPAGLVEGSPGKVLADLSSEAAGCSPDGRVEGMSDGYV